MQEIEITMKNIASIVILFLERHKFLDCISLNVWGIVLNIFVKCIFLCVVGSFIPSYLIISCGKILGWLFRMIINNVTFLSYSLFDNFGEGKYANRKKCKFYVGRFAIIICLIKLCSILFSIQLEPFLNDCASWSLLIWLVLISNIYLCSIVIKSAIQSPCWLALIVLLLYFLVLVLVVVGWGSNRVVYFHM